MIWFREDWNGVTEFISGTQFSLDKAHMIMCRYVYTWRPYVIHLYELPIGDPRSPVELLLERWSLSARLKTIHTPTAATLFFGMIGKCVVYDQNGKSLSIKAHQPMFLWFSIWSFFVSSFSSLNLLQIAMHFFPGACSDEQTMIRALENKKYKLL